MNVRKQRTHQCGLTNVDYRTKGDFASVDRFNPSLMYADVGTMNKSLFKPQQAAEVPFTEKWRTSGGWLAQKQPDPKEDAAQTYYAQQAKKSKSTVPMNVTHANLEQEKWNDKCFTGDNTAFTASLVRQASARDSAIQRGGRNLIPGMEAGIKKRFDETKDELATGGMFLHLSPTDIAAVKDIRRALRRKYTSRSNLPKIFAQWDKGSKGALNLEDLLNGICKAGITVSHDQARTLFASATTDKGQMTAQELGNLLFSCDEELNVNLSTIPVATDAEKLATTQKLSQLNGQKKLDLASLSQEQLVQFRARNHWRHCIQNKLRDILTDLMRNDEQKTNMADPNTFLKVIQSRVTVPEQIKEHHDMLYDYLLSFQDEQSGKINYKHMTKDLSTFDYNQETNEGLLPRSAASISSGAYSLAGTKPRQGIFDDYKILDGKRVPQNLGEAMEKNLIKMNRTLQRKFKSRDDFEAALKKAGCDENGNLNEDDFKSFVVEQCREDLIARDVNKKEIESFLSSFTYNKHGGTDITKIAPLVYEKDPNTLTRMINDRVRANPPPAAVTGAFGEATEEVPVRRLRDIMVDLEDKSFESKPQYYKSFTTMDKDGDGFISYNDLSAHMTRLKIQHSDAELKSLMHTVLDPERKGYIDFPTFQARFGPLMSKQVSVSDEQEIHEMNLVPNQTKFEEYREKQKKVKGKIAEVTKVFRPDQDQMKLVPATRFGAKPSHPNTFYNYQQDARSPGFISESERLGDRSSVTMNTKVDFQKQEKEKNRCLTEARLAMKQKRIDEASARIVMAEQELLSRDTFLTMKKAQVNDTYEKCAKMGGIY